MGIFDKYTRYKGNYLIQFSGILEIPEETIEKLEKELKIKVDIEDKDYVTAILAIILAEHTT